MRSGSLPLLIAGLSVLPAFAGRRQENWSTRKPPALLALEQARLAIRKGDVKWTRSDFFSQLSHGETKYHRSIFSGDQIAYINDGTADGYTAWTEDGTPIRRPEGELRTPDAWWQLSRDDLVARLWKGEIVGRLALVPDLRSLGLLPLPAQFASVQEALWDWPRGNPSPRKYRQRRVGGVFEVEMLLENSGTIVRWHIDPKLDWNVTRCQQVYQGEVVAETFTDYEQHDGVWFPSSVAQLNSVGDMVTLIEIESARINTDDIPDELTPEIIGMGNGMPVIPQQGVPQPPSGHGNFVYGGAGRILTFKEYRDLKHQGLIKTDPRYLALREQIIAQSKSASSVEATRTQAHDHQALAGEHPPRRKPPPAIVRNRVDDDWERYTREFIVRFKLDKGQTNAAWRILRDCQEQRTKYLRSRRERTAQLQERLSAKKTAEVGRKLLRELQKLKRPIQDIFEKQLKPRLDRLPTRKQRKAADATSTDSASGAPKPRGGG